MSKFFIDRPIFAIVISLLIVLVGGVAITQLPVAQYPSVAPPSITITSSYAGASAEVLQNTVTSIIEQQLSGIDNLLYMASTSNSSGQSQIMLYFEPGTNPDTAQVQVQNKLQLAIPALPVIVQQAGVTVTKSTRNYLLFFTLSTPNGSMDEIQLGNYIASYVLDPIRRLPGVGDANEFGTENAMRVWLNPHKLFNYNMTAIDVINAIGAQNVQVPVGQLGDRPAVTGQQLNVTLQGQSTLSNPKEFGNIILRVNQDGSRVYLRDVATIALGGLDYSTRARINGHPSAAVAVKLSPTANAVQTADAIHAKVKQLSKFFPPNVEVNYPLDQSAFVRISIEEVVKTLLIAIFLVFCVMYLFLQSMRTTLIPTIVVPVALMGAFSVLKLFGFSINVLTLFGMVLAIGMLVDDAIVVVENCERLMREEGLSPRDASIKAMEQITGALIGISLVLTAVFIPMAFFGGSVGAIYRQFAVSLIACMLFSIFLALSLTPALCAAILKPIQKDTHDNKGGFFGLFNRSFESGRTNYQKVVGKMLGRSSKPYFAIYFAIVLIVGFLYMRLPSSFLPEEDQGYFITNIQLPVGATQVRTLEVLKKVEKYFLSQPEIAEVITVAGFSFNGRGQNSALSFIRLKDWSQRPGDQHKAPAIIRRAFGAFSQIKDAIIYPVNLPPIPELGVSSGFDLQLEDQGGLGHLKLMDAAHQLMANAAKNPNVFGVRMQGLEDAAQLKINIDEDKAAALGIPLGDINTALQANFGSYYVNNFVHGNRVQRVIVMLDAPYRMLPSDISKVYLRNSSGGMVSLSSLVRLNWTYGSPQLQRYNGFPSLEIVGSSPPGKSTGDAMKAMEDLINQLPKGIGFEWTGQSYEERIANSQAPALYTISSIVVFLALAALYESWSIPFAVMLIVPLGVLGSLLAASMRGLPDDVYFKVGLLAIIGLSTKNAILIVEFAKDLHAEGKGLVEATLEAAHLRLRPILMTSLAFILGVMPLALSTGAGSASQHAIGTGVAGGMLTATFLAIIFVPVFFVSVMRVFAPKKKDVPKDQGKKV